MAHTTLPQVSARVDGVQARDQAQLADLLEEDDIEQAVIRPRHGADAHAGAERGAVADGDRIGVEGPFRQSAVGQEGAAAERHAPACDDRADGGLSVRHRSRQPRGGTGGVQVDEAAEAARQDVDPQTPAWTSVGVRERRPAGVDEAVAAAGERRHVLLGASAEPEALAEVAAGAGGDDAEPGEGGRGRRGRRAPRERRDVAQQAVHDLAQRAVAADADDERSALADGVGREPRGVARPVRAHQVDLAQRAAQRVTQLAQLPAGATAAGVGVGDHKRHGSRVGVWCPHARTVSDEQVCVRARARRAGLLR